MSSPAPDPVFVLRGARSSVMSVTFLHPPEGGTLQMIAAGTQDGHILIWDLKTKCVVKEWLGNCSSSILWLHSQSPEELWTQGRHDRIKLWDISASSPEVKMEYPITDYLGFSQSHLTTLDNNTKLLAIPGPNQLGVSVWNIDTKHKICSLLPSDSTSRGSLMQARWIKLKTNVSLIVLYESGHICLWDWNSQKIISEAKISENPVCLTFDDNSETGIIGTASEKVFIFHCNSDFTISIVKEICITNAGLSSCIIRPDGKLLVTGGWDSRIRIFSSRKCKPLAVLQYHKKTVECLAYSTTNVECFGSGFLLAAGSSDNSISLWNIFT